MIILQLLKKVWNSPTITTWGSFFTRVLSLLIVLPIVLSNFSTANIALWYLFLTIISMQSLADIGFGATFTRVIAYAMGGATRLEDYRTVKNTTATRQLANWSIIEKIVGTMNIIYLRLTLLIFVALAVIGTMTLLRPISYSDNTVHSWISWIIIIFATCFTFLGITYTNYLQGINQIPLLMRWQAIFSLGAVLTNFVVLLLNGDILALVISHQSWSVANVFLNSFFCRKVEEGRFVKFKNNGIDPVVFQSVWPSAWRSGVGILMSYGVIQASGLVYAQIGNISSLASYLLALRIMNNIRTFCQAPFYSKLPLLSRLRAEGRVQDQIRISSQGMFFSYWVFVVTFIFVGLFAEPLLTFIGSNAEFVSPLMWILLGIGFYLERYGAMHIQLYSTTNHIIWHIANGVSGIIYVISSMILLRYIDIYAFPVGIILGYLGFYTWYSTKYSYKTFNLNFWKFESRVMIPSFGVLILYSMLILLVRGISI